jgi:hypothetical protein
MGDATSRGIGLVLACALSLTAGCGGGGSGANGPIPVPSIQPTSSPTSPTPTPTPVNAGIGAMVATLDTSTLAASGSTIAAYATNHGFHTIFLGLPWTDTHTNLPNGDPATVAALNQLAAVATVYLITGNKNWQLTPNVVPQVVVDTVKVGQMYPQINGIVYDLEPQALPNWQTARQAVVTQYVQFVNYLLVNPGGYAFKTTLLAVAPYYAVIDNSTGTADPSLLQEVEGLPTVNGTYVMDYVYPVAMQESGATPSALAQLQKPFWWGSTCDAGAPPGVSYNGTPATTFIADMANLQTFVQAGNGRFQALFAHAWNSEGTSLQTVLP